MLYAIIDLLCAAVFALPLAWAFLAFRKTGSRKQFLLISLFTLYLCEMFDVVGIPGIQYWRWNPEVNLIPFADERNPRYYLQMGLNAVMFLPFGFLLPVLWRCCRGWWKTALAGLFLSGLIEALQLFCFRYTDVDDLLMNALGALLGYWLSWLLFHRKWRTSDGIDGSWLSVIAAVANPLLVTVFLRSLVSDWVYSLPMFR